MYLLVVNQFKYNDYMYVIANKNPRLVKNLGFLYVLCFINTELTEHSKTDSMLVTDSMQQPKSALIQKHRSSNYKD